jgi:integral membrane protein
VKKLFAAYRVLALTVGVLLLVGVLGSAMKYLLTEGTTLQRLGDDLGIIWLLHGWVYIVYLVVAFMLTQRARWSIPSFLLMLVAGLVPGLIFWVEHRAAQRLRADHPELAAA